MLILRNKNSNRFCGPAALAALADVHVDEAARTLREVSGHRAIKGIQNRHMVSALAVLQHMALPVPVVARPTLTQALRGPLKGRRPQDRYLVLITGHYVCVQGRKLVDNRHPDGIALTACPYRRRRVRGIWAVQRFPLFVSALGVLPKEKLKPRPQRLTFAQFGAAMAKLGLETNGYDIDAPQGYRFSGGSEAHCLCITGSYEEALESVHEALPLVACPADCECRD